MNAKAKRWWLELADQYEEWSYHVPDSAVAEYKPEYTCLLLEEGFLEDEDDFGKPRTLIGLQRVWCMAGYVDSPYPTGSMFLEGRTYNAVKDFCMDMAETIRENVGGA